MRKGMFLDKSFLFRFSVLMDGSYLPSVINIVTLHQVTLHMLYIYIMDDITDKKLHVVNL